MTMTRIIISHDGSLRAKSESIPSAKDADISSESDTSACCRPKPRARSLNHLFSIESYYFHGSALKKSANQDFDTPPILLGIGRPVADFYPWSSLEFQADRVLPRLTSGEIDLTRPGTKAITMHGEGYNLARGLNYGRAAGSQALLRFVTDHVKIVHDPPYDDWTSCLSSGSTSALEIALRMFCNRRDTILTERYTYPGLIEATKLFGVHIQGIEMDAGGLDPGCLEQTLRGWDESHGPRPHVLYTIPSGQNPIGVTQSFLRKKAIYQIAEDYDLIVIEDDPYYFLPMTENPRPDETCDERDHQISAYVAGLTPSFLSLDQSGRVIRLDSTSKILAPGLRAGWVSASRQIIEKFLAYYEVSTVAVSGPTQLMLWDLFDNTWGHLGFFAWLDNLAARYRARLSTLLKACESYLPREVCRWARPQSGMFLWISVELQKHPILLSYNDADVGSHASIIEAQARDIEARISSKALENGVQVTVGSLFDTSKVTRTTLHFRLTYAAASQSEIDEGVKRFARAIKEDFELD